MHRSVIKKNLVSPKLHSWPLHLINSLAIKTQNVKNLTLYSSSNLLSLLNPKFL